jgi:protein-L-isoaspartate(D-aspartate) O-methyltransferase
VPASALDRLVAQVARNGVSDPLVLQALRDVPRERFVPAQYRAYAFEDGALPIGEGQTISQPTIVGMMTQALQLRGGERVLEVGGGSGYQAAVLSRIAGEVVSVELNRALCQRARVTLAELGIENVRVLEADPDVIGAPGEGPFDAILVAAASPELPPPLVDQVVEGGHIVIPIGSRDAQQLMLVTRTGDGLEWDDLGPCRFVPLLGRFGIDAGPGGGGTGPVGQEGVGSL